MLQTKLEFYSFLCLMSHLLRKHKYMLILKADIYEARFCWSAQECSTAGQAFKMHLKECSFSSRPGLARFSMQSRGVWLCLMGWDLLRPKIAWLSPSYWPEYMRGAVCASQRHKLLLFKLILGKILLSVESYPILPLSVKWPREHKSNWD